MSTELPVESFAGHFKKRLKSVQELGEGALRQLEPVQFFAVPAPGSNSIAIIIQHLYGNMMSRFTQFLTEDGEKHWRKRDAEFEPMDVSAADLMDFWRTGWATVWQAVDGLSPADWLAEVSIRGEKMPAYDALLRQLSHYSYHVGQIVYLAKMLQGETFESLSIPRGQSAHYRPPGAAPAQSGTPS